MLIEINDETPIAMLTVGQLKEILSHSTPTEVHVQQCPQKHLVYGYDGLARLLKVSRVRAGQIIRGGQIADAVTQSGRSIVIDADKALVLLGILDRRGGLVRGIPRHVVARPCCRLAYIRGALIAGGFVADPRGDFHLEIAVQGEEFADALAELIGQIGVNARVNRRKSTFAVYVKSARDIRALLEAVGAQRSVDVLEDARAMKSVKNDVNRKVNAELANQTRSAGAAQHQLELIAEVERRGLRGTLPRALEDFCALREAYPDLSLRDLGEVSDPPLSKSALYHRVLRLEKLLE